MKAYADTVLLSSLNAPDAHTAAAIARMNAETDALPITWLHELELRNALRLRVFRRQITAAQKEASSNLFLADSADGFLAGASPDLGGVSKEAERLSASFSERLGVRSPDILHVAGALELGAADFWSFDSKQAALAGACGPRLD